ncbi:hypothetical protein [Haloferax sp. ATB1]|uniref:hypothetical protein n=1 Tax=Haloferax sp. ATB1 TaxID=1508454 RepID=UPI0005B213EA|nr:hypothetical protein [Haloferax sp. ATB1]
MTENATESGLGVPAQETTASENRLITDGGITTANNCPHEHTRRYGKTDFTGSAVIEKRCIVCGRTLSLGGSR